MMPRVPYARHYDPAGTGTVVLYIGTPAGWRAARRDIEAGARDILLLPAGDDPRSYRWPDLVGRSVYVVDDRSHADDTADIARHLIHVGAREVLWSGRRDDVLYVPEAVVA